MRTVATIVYRLLRFALAIVTMTVSATFYIKRKYYDEPFERAFKSKK